MFIETAMSYRTYGSRLTHSDGGVQYISTSSHKEGFIRFSQGFKLQQPMF